MSQPKKAKAQAKRPNALMAFAQSQLGILLISGVLIGGGAKLYNDMQAQAADVETRRTAYVEMLAEFQHRVSLLGQADGQLDPFIGEGTDLKNARSSSESRFDLCEFERFSAEVGRQEADILRGTGGYVPTNPQFKNIDLLTLSARMERTAGIPDIDMGALRLLGFLSTSPDILWIFVRAHHPQMMKFGVTRHMLYTTGEIPLRRGAELTQRQETMLGFPKVNPGDLERKQQETKKKHAQLQQKLRDAETAPTNCPR